MADPNEVGGVVGQWVVDPQNPNRATYTDEFGEVYEAFKDEPVAPVEGVSPQEVATPEQVRPSVVMGTAPKDTAPRVLPTPKVATQIKFGDEITALDNNVWKEKAAEEASIFDQMMADRRFTEQDIRDRVAQSGFTVENLDENLALRAKGERTKNAVVDARFNDPLGQLDQPIDKIAPGDRGGWDRLTDYFTSESQRGFQGILRRAWDDWADTGKDQLRQQFPGMDEAWYETMSELVSRIGQKAIIQEVEARNTMDPSWSPDESFIENAISINRWGPALVGVAAGSTGPETFLSPGRTAVARILNQGLISGISRVGYNSVDYLQGVSEDLDVEAALIDATVGAVTQGAFEVPGLIKNLMKNRGRDLTPGADPRQPSPTFGEDTAKVVEQTAVKQVIESIDPKLKPRLSDRYVNRVVDEVNNITSGWKNAPEIRVARDEQEILDNLGVEIDTDAIGVVLPDGTVAINLKNVDSPETLRAVVFHEGLGHHGLVQQFGDKLDETLEKMYAQSSFFQNKVDQWISNNPEAYAEDVNPLARAAEEVLAEMSEAGRMPPPLWKKVERVVREFARKFMDVDLNEREISVILDMAHSATVNGKPRDVAGNGFKYARVYHGSPYDFEKFDTNKIGTGEGSQAYGWGLYFAENKQVAESYRDILKEYKGGKNNTGKLFEVDLPDNVNLFSWDKQLKDQPQIEQTLQNAGWVRQDKLWKDISKAREAYNDAKSSYGFSSPEAKDRFKIIQNLLASKAEKSYSGEWEGARLYRQITANMSATAEGSKLVREEGRGALEKDASLYLKSIGIDGTRYLDRNSRVDAKGTSNIVLYDDTLPVISSKYMRKRQAGTGSEGPLQGGSRKQARDEEVSTNLGLGNFRSRENIEDILAEQAPDYTPESWDEWIEQANDVRNKVKVAKGLKEGSSAPEVLAAREAIVKSANRIAQLSRKAADGTLTERDEYFLMAEMARNATMQEALAGVRANAARIVNSFKITVESDEAFADSIRNMMARVKNDVIGNPENRRLLIEELAQHANNPQAINRISRDAFKAKAEDYMFRAWYNMLLSAPGTHEVNFLGTGGNFIYDLLENTGAAILGQGKRFSNADRVRAREVAYRVWGALRAITTANTWRNAGRSFDTGLTGNMPNSKMENSNVYTGNDKKIKAISYVLESPTRALAGADEWWRGVIQLSNLYGLAVRNAGNKGLKGSAFWNEVNRLIDNPTKEMIDQTNSYTQTLQFLDKPSKIAQGLINIQTPKKNDGTLTRVGRGLLKVAVPFVRTPDALIRTAIRRSGFLSPLERVQIAEWQAGGAARDKAKARMIMGSALAFYVSSQVYAGNITGNGPERFDEQQNWLGTHQPNSIKIGDQWYSIQGLEPVSTNITAIASLVERYRAGEINEDDYAKSAISATHALASTLIDNSYAENLLNLVDVFSADPQKAENAITNFFVGIGASATVPAILRSYTQSEDPAIRDTTGDGTFGSRLEGRISSGVPGLSEQLPQKYDVYGRPMSKESYDPAGRLRQKDVETDPTVIELERLREVYGKALVGPPKKTGISVNGEEPRRLTAEEFEAYQQLSGYWIVESVREEMTTPEWEALTDEERIELVNDIKRDMRANAREYLFGNPDEEEDVEGE